MAGRVTTLGGAAAVLGALMAAGPASAAQVEVRSGDEFRSSISYEAAPGERNDLLLSSVDDYTVRVADPGATITPGPGCRAIDAHTAECSTSSEPTQPFLYTAHVAAGDMDDVVRSSHERVAGISGSTALSGPGIVADGGPGDDMLVGSTIIADELDGGGGRDRLFGHGNDDTLTDGDSSRAANADRLDGGEGSDEVSYASRTRRVMVDLSDSRRDGAHGEGDLLRSIERAAGGSGNDLLVGNSTYNALHGGRGNDRLEGHGHGDGLFGGPGDDRLYGQRGNDTLEGGDGANLLDGGPRHDVIHGMGGTDTVRCGPGLEVAVDVDPADFLGRDCETVRYLYDPDGVVPASDGEGDVSIRMQAHPVSVRRDSLTFSIECPRTTGNCDPAEGTIQLNHARTGVLLGRGALTDEAGRQSAESGRPARVRVRLTRRGRFLAARRKGVMTTVSVSGRLLPTAGWTIHVRSR
jgi:hypothetical protein